MTNRIKNVPQNIDELARLDEQSGNPMEALMALLGGQKNNPTVWLDTVMNMQPKEGNKIAVKGDSFTNPAKGVLLLFGIKVPNTSNVSEDVLTKFMVDIRNAVVGVHDAFEKSQRQKVSEN